MIPIYIIEDIELVKDIVLKEALYREFERLPDDFEYPTFGYFIVIESIKELQQPICLKYNGLEITLDNFKDCVEMIEEFEGYNQIVCLLDNDFGVSLFVKT